MEKWRNETLFCKIFKMPCPVPAYLDHYLDALRGTPYENLVHLHRHWLRLNLTVTDIHRAVSDFEADAIHDLQDFGVIPVSFRLGLRMDSGLPVGRAVGEIGRTKVVDRVIIKANQSRS